MTIGCNFAAPESPAKKRKTARPPKPWATCTKSSFQEWRKDDYLAEFNMRDSDWDVLDAQVSLQASHLLT